MIAAASDQGWQISAGVCYIVAGHKLLISTARESWKAKHIALNPHVALTVTLPKRIPFMPWIKIPAATISFHGTAQLLAPESLDEATLRRLMGANAASPEELARCVIIEVTPGGDFVTYGVGTSLMEMRDYEKARGRAPVAA